MSTEYEEIAVKAKEIHEKIASERVRADQIRQRTGTMLSELPTTKTELTAIHSTMNGMIRDTEALKQTVKNNRKHQKIGKTKKIAKTNLL